MRRDGSRCRSGGTLAAALVAIMIFPVSAKAAGLGTLKLSTIGLPSGQRAAILMTGPGTRRVVRSTRTSLRVPAGRYWLTVERVRIMRAGRSVRRGATAYPARRHLLVSVRSGKTRRVRVLYSGVVNPSVKRLSAKVEGVVGDPRSPSAVLLPRRTATPRIGTIFISAATPRLPRGLMSKVTSAGRQGRWLVVSLQPVPVIEATPKVTFDGNLPFTALDGATQQLGSEGRASEGAAAKATAKPMVRMAGANCVPPNVLKFHAQLDSVELREASLGAFPPQLRLTLAVRTTESLGVALAAAGINCDFGLGNIGPYQAAIPVGPVVIPVYMTLPVRAGIHINGTLNAGTLNLANTTVASIRAGFKENGASFSQQGSNIWISGTPSISGSAKLTASVGVQAGIGVVKGANVHLQADFGPELTWTGSGCEVNLILGALSAGVNVFGKSLNTPAFRPFVAHLYSGCRPNSGGGGGSTGGSAPGPSPGPAPSPNPGPAPTYRTEQEGSLGANTFTNPYNASGQGSKIPAMAYVDVTCKVYAPQIASANPDGYWYRIHTNPWNDAYYAVANTFWNGDVPGHKPYTHNTDFSVPDC